MFMSVFSFDSTAQKIGIQIYRAAKSKAYESGKTADSKSIAVAMANRFQSEILRAIDDEERFQSAKQVQ